jgi:hypothetical protein
MGMLPLGTQVFVKELPDRPEAPYMGCVGRIHGYHTLDHGGSYWVEFETRPGEYIIAPCAYKLFHLEVWKGCPIIGSEII